MRVSTSNLMATGTGVAVATSAQNTLSASEGATTGDAGRLPASSGPLRKKKVAVVVPKPSRRPRPGGRVNRSESIRRDLLAGGAADTDAVREARVDAHVAERIGAIGVLVAELPAGQTSVVDADLIGTGAPEPGALTEARAAA